eukprot:332360-Lingulodinium_polyedra.AAC.1
MAGKRVSTHSHDGFSSISRLLTTATQGRHTFLRVPVLWARILTWTEWQTFMNDLRETGVYCLHSDGTEHMP